MVLSEFFDFTTHAFQDFLNFWLLLGGQLLLVIDLGVVVVLEALL